MTTQTSVFKFRVNDREFESDRPNITGDEIRQIAQVPPAYQLFQEVHGHKAEDKIIGNDDVVDLSAPGIEKLYTVPPATFGYSGSN